MIKLLDVYLVLREHYLVAEDPDYLGVWDLGIRLRRRYILGWETDTKLATTVNRICKLLLFSTMGN